MDIEPGVPKCLIKKIESFDKSPACNKGASVKEYNFKDKTVYVLYPGNYMNDGGSEVIDSDCNKIGYLGGIEGNTKVNGVEFSNAIYLRNVWKK